MTMTLDELKEAVADICAGCDSERSLFTNADLGDAIDAAIRERDRLRGDVAGMTEELLHVPSRDDWRELQQRAERAEAELAALKARIAGGWLCGVSNDKCRGHFDAAIYCLPSRFRGKRVRLVVEE